MISVAAVLCTWLVYAWLPTTAHARLAMLTGRGAAVPLDVRYLAWTRARQAQGRGQPETTRLLQMLVGELMAGIVTPQAFAHVVGADCASPAMLLETPPTADTHIWHDVAQVWAASERAGLSMAVALQRIHAYALVDQEVAREVRANTAAPQFAVLTLVLLPVLAWMTAGATGARPIEFLTHTPVGWLCAVVGLGLFGGAVMWMRALTKQALT